jgi:hypothetical protein
MSKTSDARQLRGFLYFSGLSAAEAGNRIRRRWSAFERSGAALTGTGEEGQRAVHRQAASIHLISTTGECNNHNAKALKLLRSGVEQAFFRDPPLG